jgi:putative nucleotidyltransferase with HDIG domain
MSGQPAERFAFLIADHSAAVPTLPDVAHRAIALASDPDVEIGTLADLVERDPVFASRVMGFANSAFSAPLVYASTVKEAIIRVGTSAVRNIIMTVSLASRVQDVPVYGPRGRALFDHALGTACLARAIAERTGLAPEQAFLAGLMHDIGKLVILKLAFDHVAAAGEPIPPAELEDALRERHAMMGALALRRWHLPEEIDDPVMFHHQYESASRHQREAAACYLANRLSHRYGFGCTAEPSEPAAFAEDPAFTVMGLDAGWLQRLDGQAPSVFAAARASLA